MAGGFSIRGYAESLRRTGAADLGPFTSAAKELQPLEVRVFRWWEDELASVKAAEAEREAVAGLDEAEEEEEAAASGHGRAPKKRSITDLFAEAPAVGAVGSGPDAVVDEEEVLRSIVRRSKELRRKRRLEQASSSASASAAADEPETSAAGERRAAEGNFPRKKSVDKPSLGDELDTSGSSKEHENDDFSTEKEMMPDPKRRKHGRLSNSLQQKKAERLKYLESRKAAKDGKQRDIKKVLPLHSILKKYTKHTSVKMVKEKHGSSKGPGVIQLCRKSVKRVKFSEMDDAKKQPSKRQPLESICELLSAISSSSSSSLEMSSEEEHVIAESSDSRMPSKAFTMSKEAKENTNLDTQYELSSTGLCLLDLNQALPEPTDLNNPYVPNSDVSYLEHTEVGTLHVGQQLADNGRRNDTESSFDLHGQGQQRHPNELDTRSKGNPCTLPNHFQDSVHLQQNWRSMTLHRGASQLSTGGEPSSFQFRGSNLSHSEKRNFHSEMNVQQESSPSAGQTLRLMGHDLTVSNTRVDCLSYTAQNHANPTAGHLTTKVVLELPRQGQPFLSLQTQSIPTVSASSANAVAHVSASSPSAVAHVSACSTSTAQVHFGYRTPHNVSHPLLTANVFSGDPSVYEDRSRDFRNLQSHRKSLLGYPPLSNHGSAAFLQNSPPWLYYSDHSTRTDSPSAPFTPTMMQHVATSSDYRANLSHQSHGVFSPTTVQPRTSASITPNQIVQGVDSRASANLPSRNPGTGTTRAAPDNSNTSSSSRFVLRSGPVKLSAGAKHILIPNENTEDDNSAPMYSCVSFGSSNANVSAAHQNKGAAGSRMF